MSASPTLDPTDRRDALATRLFAGVSAALELQTVYLGDRLGLYEALARGGPATALDLAARAGIAPRYAREWLEQQAVAGILDVDDAAAGPNERHYSLPAGHDEVLLDPSNLSFAAGVVRFPIGSAQRMPDLIDAFRSGRGLDWATYGPDVIEAQEGANRPQFEHHVAEWLDDLPDIAARLRDGSGRVADVACGTGWSSISIARHYPGVQVDGIDVDMGSIARAAVNAADAGVADRVTFLHADGAAADGAGRYDLVTIFESLHDMARPAEVLVAARELLAPGGAVLVADERTAEAFSAPGDDLERVLYAYSVVCCLPCGLYDEPSVGTGTMLRPDALEAIAGEAGFTRTTVLPTAHDQFRFYRLDP
jgi:2-polyprenyl-3-methyl-5-hydroxy-6-metoxy-1,4-benzoquinol methylase